MKKLISLLTGILILTGCSGCFYLFSKPKSGWSSGSYSTRYSILVKSDDASDITIYLPFPYYKGKPDKRYLKWLKKHLIYERSWRGYLPKQMKVDLVDTEYGKMLYIYMSDISEKMSSIYFETDSDGSSRPIKINPKTLFDNYKLTGEDKIKPEKEENDPEDSDYIQKRLKMPIYVQFEGKEFKMDFYYHIKYTEWSWGSEPFYMTCLSYFPEDRNNHFVFNKSGWHWMPVIKKEIKNKEEE